MQTTSSLSRTVMSRVHVVHFIRPLFSSTALASLLFLLAVWGISREVWVAHVFANMVATGNVVSFTRFLTEAFLNTRLTVQVLAIGAVAAFAWVMRDAFRNLSMVGKGQFA